MAFGQKITKQDLIDAGLDPDKFNTLIGTAVAKTDLDSLKAGLEATQKTALDEVKALIAGLEGKIVPKPPTGDNGGGDNNGQPKQKTAEEKFAEYMADPVKYIESNVGNLGAAAAVEFKRMSRDLAYNTLSQSLTGFKNETLKAEIDEEWKKYSPEMLARNNGDPSVVLRQVHDMVMGRHYEDIQRDSAKKEGKFNLVHSGTSGGGGGTGSIGGNGGGGNDGKTALTDAEKLQAAKFGMTDDEWRQQSKDMDTEELTRRKIPVGAGA